MISNPQWLYKYWTKYPIDVAAVFCFLFFFFQQSRLKNGMRCGVQFGHGGQKASWHNWWCEGRTFWVGGRERTRAMAWGHTWMEMEITLVYWSSAVFAQIQDLKEQEHWNALKCGSGAVIYAYLLAKWIISSEDPLNSKCTEF